MENYGLLLVCIFSWALGLCLGGILNAVIDCLPHGLRLMESGLRCPFCQCKLRWYDRIPLISYAVSGGRCRVCKRKRSFRYPAVSLANACLWLLCALLLWEKSVPLACIGMAVMSVFLCVFMIDLAHRIIFDCCQLALLVLGAASIFFDRDFSPLSHIIGGIGGFAFFYGIALSFEKLFGKEGMGGGDVKLAGVAGLLLGWERLLLGILLATVSASVIMGIFFKNKKREDREFPFAPFLVSGFGISLLFGSHIIDWYLSLFG